MHGKGIVCMVKGHAWQGGGACVVKGDMHGEGGVW